MGADSSRGSIAREYQLEPLLFQESVELLRLFLTHREAIVERIEAVLSAQRTPSRYMQGRSFLSRQIDDCFFARTLVTASQTQLRGQLEQAYWAVGFKPREVQHLFNDLIDPAEMMTRAVHCWQQTRWPGRSDRQHYAHTLFNLYGLRCFQFLSLRLWDQDPGSAPQRLAEIQQLLDQLWTGSPAGQPRFVRDARWLIPLAQSLITDALAPYFQVAQLVTDTLPEADVFEIQRAHVRMLGGHLTSQIRHYCTRDGLTINDPSVVMRTRSSNALDLALLVQGLVWLLRAYERALRSGDERTRLDMAGAIYQGISPDPELFLSRVDILNAYTMIEDVFVTTDLEGHIVYSPTGQRHVQLVREYASVMERLIAPLGEDLPRCKPVEGGCSPYGILFGLPSTLIEHMALKAVERDAETRFSLEDVFDEAGSGPATLAWVNGWRKLPHVSRDMQRIFEYPQSFAVEVYERIAQEFRQAGNVSTVGRLYVGSNPTASEIPEVPARYFGSSDPQLVDAHKADAYDQAQLLRDRQEGHFLVSYKTAAGWTALKKSLLAEVLGAGQDARIVGLPPDAQRVLQLMGGDLVMLENAAGQETVLS